METAPEINSEIIHQIGAFLMSLNAFDSSGKVDQSKKSNRVTNQQVETIGILLTAYMDTLSAVSASNLSDDIQTMKKNITDYFAAHKQHGNFILFVPPTYIQTEVRSLSYDLKKPSSSIFKKRDSEDPRRTARQKISEYGYLS